MPSKYTFRQKKEIQLTTEGKCLYCKKHVKSLEAHIKIKHKGEKIRS